MAGKGKGAAKAAPKKPAPRKPRKAPASKPTTKTATPKKDRALTERQQRFVAHYAVLGNAKQAAIAAGFSVKTAGQIGHSLTCDPRIQAALQEATADVREELSITRDKVLQRLWDESQMYGVTASHSARIAALTQIAKMNGWNQADTGPDGGIPGQYIEHRIEFVDAVDGAPA